MVVYSGGETKKDLIHLGSQDKVNNLLSLFIKNLYQNRVTPILSFPWEECKVEVCMLFGDLEIRRDFFNRDFISYWDWEVEDNLAWELSSFVLGKN